MVEIRSRNVQGKRGHSRNQGKGGIITGAKVELIVAVALLCEGMEGPFGRALGEEKEEASVLVCLVRVF